MLLRKGCSHEIWVINSWLHDTYDLNIYKKRILLQINFLVTLHSTTSINKNLLFLHSVHQSCKVCTRLLHEISQGERHLFVHKVNLSQVGKGDNIQLKQEFTIINNSYKMTVLEICVSHWRCNNFRPIQN